MNNNDYSIHYLHKLHDVLVDTKEMTNQELVLETKFYLRLFTKNITIGIYYQPQDLTFV